MTDIFENWNLHSMFSSFVMPSALCHSDNPNASNFQDLIDFCKDTGLQSSAAATRNATIKLIGALHRFVGPGIIVLSCCNGLFVEISHIEF